MTIASILAKHQPQRPVSILRDGVKGYAQDCEGCEFQAFVPSSARDYELWSQFGAHQADMLTAERPLQLTITATVDPTDFAAFLQDHANMEDVADSFNVRLNEVFGSGAEVLTTVRVQSVSVF